MATPIETAARLAYERYARRTQEQRTPHNPPNKSVIRPIPTWDELKENQRPEWRHEVATIVRDAAEAGGDGLADRGA